jgi:hypothetical protein
MSPLHLPNDLPQALIANREELRRRSRSERIRPLWLWVGILTGPVAFAAVRLASIILLSHGCGGALSPAVIATAGITLVGAVVTVGAGLLSWYIWRWTSLREDEVSTGNMPRVPFFAMGGVLVSAFCLFGIVTTGGLALALSGGCA